MPDPVKISELPAISSVQPGDILPIVDAALTQTSKATAAQIAAIGGGPPGDGTVTTGKIVNGAVTAPKVGFTGPDKLISRTLTGAGEGVEIPCTAYARGLLATSTSAGALSYLGGLQSANDPTFSGTVTVNGSIVATGNSSISGNSSASTITVTGSISRPLSGVTGGTPFPVYGSRAWVNFNGANGTIRAGDGISSVWRYAAGHYRVYFSNASMMPDTNYAILCLYRDVQTGNGAYDAIYNTVSMGGLAWQGLKLKEYFDIFAANALDDDPNGMIDTSEYNVVVWR